MGKVTLSEATNLIGVFDELVGGIAEALVDHCEARRVLVGCIGYFRAHPDDGPCEGNYVSDHQVALSKARACLDIQLSRLSSFLATDQRSRVLQAFATAHSQRDRVENPSERWAQISTILGVWETVAALVDTDRGPIDALNQEQIGRIADDRVHAILARMTILVALMKNFCQKAALELD